MAELSQVKVVERDIEIVHPSTKAEMGITITLMSPNDKRLDKLRDQVGQKQIAIQAKGKVQKIDEIKENRQRILFAAITKWNWHEDADGEQAVWNGEVPDLTPKNFNEICNELSWFRDQIDEAFAETERFFL